MIRCYIGLGSNLANPALQLSRAFLALQALTQCSLVTVSPCYGSRAVGPGKQDDYINAVAELGTTLSPDHLLDALHAIEKNQQRIRQQRWGPRTLDLDLLLYGDKTIDTPQLQVPHPRLHQRDFVLRPLLDISPNLRLPNGTLIQSLLQHAQDNQLRQLDRTTFERLAQEQ